MNKFYILAVRVILGVLGGWFLGHFFFPQGGIPVKLILAVLVVAAAYASEFWRSRKKG